jgi:transcription initiation factor TFIIIB Brf1 subunit/transcription initiation factor TFIIB
MRTNEQASLDSAQEAIRERRRRRRRFERRIKWAKRCRLAADAVRGFAAAMGELARLTKEVANYNQNRGTDRE